MEHIDIENKERENGFYWVTWIDRQIAEYRNGIWWLPRDGEGKYEDELIDINENRIIEDGKE